MISGKQSNYEIENRIISDLVLCAQMNKMTGIDDSLSRIVKKSMDAFTRYELTEQSLDFVYAARKESTYSKKKN